MSLSDFLFEGRPPPSVTQYGSTQSNIPQWMNDYNMALVARANQIAAEPYQAYGGPRIAPFSPDTENAFGLTRTAANAYQGPLARALGLTEEAAAPGQGGLATATPYMTSAARSFPTAVSEYMDPYVGNVIDRAKLEARRFYDESLAPGLTNKFTAAGQYGSSAHMREADRAARDLTEGLQSKADASLSQAYTNAGQMFGQDASRQLGLAQVAGQLGTADQNTRLDVARQLGALGQLQQQLGLTGAAAMDTIGQQQQQQQQRNLDLAYGDFQRQTQYPRQTVDWLASVIRGMPAPVSTSTTETKPADFVGPSGLQQIGSAATGIAGLWNLYKDTFGNSGSSGYSLDDYGSGKALDDALEEAGISGEGP